MLSASLRAVIVGLYLVLIYDGVPAVALQMHAVRPDNVNTFLIKAFGVCGEENFIANPHGFYAASQTNRYHDTNQAKVSQEQLIVSYPSSELPRSSGVLSSLCVTSRLTKIGVVSVFWLLTIGLIWAGIGLFLLGDYYRRYENKLWVPRWPGLVGVSIFALGIVAYVGGIGLSKTFGRCEWPSQKDSYESSKRKVVQPTATKH